MKKINYILAGLLTLGFATTSFAANIAGTVVGAERDLGKSKIQEHGDLISDQIVDFNKQVAEDPSNGGDMTFGAISGKLASNESAFKGEVDGTPTLIFDLHDRPNENGCASNMHIMAQLYSKIGGVEEKVTAANYYNGEDKNASDYIWKVKVCSGLNFAVDDAANPTQLTASDATTADSTVKKCVGVSQADTANEYTRQLPEGRSKGLMEKDDGVPCLLNGDVLQ